MSDTPPARWRRPVDAAGLLLGVWLVLHVFRYRVTETVQSTLWAVHPVVPGVPQVGDKALIPMVEAALWLGVTVLVALLLVGVLRSGRDPADDSIDHLDPE